MQAQWQSLKVPGNPSGVTRYNKGSSHAEIHREAGHSVEAELKEGFLGLGTHVHGSYGDPTLDDKAILGKLEAAAIPPASTNGTRRRGRATPLTPGTIRAGRLPAPTEKSTHTSPAWGMRPT